MLDCLIIGDSIAVGSHMFRPECVSYSKGGVTSLGWNNMFGNKPLTAKTVIISLGTNDNDKYTTSAKLVEIRAKIVANRVFWIAPNGEKRPIKLDAVVNVASCYNDIVLFTNKYQADKIHPSWSGYKELMAQTKE